MQALIGFAAAVGTAALGALGLPASDPYMGEPIHTQEDAIIWCADEYDGQEALDCMDAAEESDLPTTWEVLNTTIA